MPKGVWGDAPSLPEYLIERTEELERLHRALQGTGDSALSQAWTGLGGIGKTTLARHYAEKYQGEYAGVVWFQADTQSNLDAGFGKVAKIVQSNNWNAQDIAEMRKGVLEWLENDARHDAAKPLLLIYDNVDEPNMVNGYRPHAAHLTILVTSRLKDLRPLVKSAAVHELGEYTPEEARAYWVKADCLDLVDATNTADADAVAEDLGWLPLAIEQAAGYIGSLPIPLPFADYRKEFAERRLALLQEGRLLGDNYTDTVMTTWALNFQNIEQTPAAEILTYCAFFAPNNIPIEIFTKEGNAAAFGAPLQAKLEEIAGSSSRFLMLCQPAINLSLLRYTGDKPARGMTELPDEITRHTLSLHRLVQEVIRHNLAQPVPDVRGIDQAKQYRNGYLERACEALAGTWAGQENNYFAANKRLIPHWQVCLELCRADDYRLRTIYVGALYFQYAALLNAQSQYTQAEPLYIQARDIMIETVGRDNHLTAVTLHDLARLYKHQYKYIEAEATALAALKIFKKIIGLDHPETAKTLNLLAQLYASQGKKIEAERLYKECLEIKMGVLGRNDASTAITLQDLAILYKEQGQFSEAEHLYMDALTIFKATLGYKHPETAGTLSNLASLYAQQGDNTKAKPLFQESLAIKIETLGREHLSVAITLQDLATMSALEEKYSEAEALFLEVLAIRDKTIGHDHVEKGILLSSLAQVYANQGNFAEAEVTVKRSYDILSKLLGEDHPDTQNAKLGLYIVKRSVSPIYIMDACHSYNVKKIFDT